MGSARRALAEHRGGQASDRVTLQADHFGSGMQLYIG